MKLGDIMKVVKKVIISILLIIVATGTVAVGYFVSEGHDMYKVAIEKTSLEAKVTEIKSYPNYTKLEEIPQMKTIGLKSMRELMLYQLEEQFLMILRR